MARALDGGGGAVRQRAAYARVGSIEGVVDDLVERSEAVWATGGAREAPRGRRNA
ncbi:hypothetical protein [Nocardioides ungokensis]|uniref:hypothetical protein n=1 Tax=Nocardioides ungokensis TaxID=1643322 RepID=UPI0015DE122E|nr:hypothetical protein [Nocardioides ungokensis]